MTPIEAWAQRFDVPLQDALDIQRLMERRCRQGTRECNGDPHLRVQDRSDKNACAAEWGKDVEITIKQIDSLLAPYGLTFDPGTGLWGSVLKDGEYTADVPCRD